MSYQKQLIKQALMNVRKTNDSARIEEAKKAIWNSNLREVKGIWEATLAKLNEFWIKTKEQLKSLWEDGLKEVKLNPLSFKSVINFLRQ